MMFMGYTEKSIRRFQQKIVQAMCQFSIGKYD
jgi:hypothetical protein